MALKRYIEHVLDPTVARTSNHLDRIGHDIQQVQTRLSSFSAEIIDGIAHPLSMDGVMRQLTAKHLHRTLKVLEDDFHDLTRFNEDILMPKYTLVTQCHLENTHEFQVLQAAFHDLRYQLVAYISSLGVSEYDYNIPPPLTSLN